MGGLHLDFRILAGHFARALVARSAGLSRSFSSTTLVYRSVSSSGRASGLPRNAVSSHPTSVAALSVTGNGPSLPFVRAQRKVPNYYGLSSQHWLRRQRPPPSSIPSPPPPPASATPTWSTPRRDPSPEAGPRPQAPRATRAPPPPEPPPAPSGLWMSQCGNQPDTTLHSALPSLDAHGGRGSRMTPRHQPPCPVGQSMLESGACITAQRGESLLVSLPACVAVTALICSACYAQ